MFDDSFLHSAANKTDSQRIVLIVDLWHPNLTITEVRFKIRFYKGPVLEISQELEFFYQNSKNHLY